MTVNTVYLSTCSERFQGLNSVATPLWRTKLGPRRISFSLLQLFLNWMRTKVFQKPQPCHACRVTVPIICFWIPDWCFALGALQTWTWMENKKKCRQLVQLTKVWLRLTHTLVCILCAKERKCSASRVQLALFTYFGLFADGCGCCRCPTFYCTFAKTSCTLSPNSICTEQCRRDSLETSFCLWFAVLNWTFVRRRV